jgi:hypothetical protein
MSAGLAQAPVLGVEVLGPLPRDLRARLGALGFLGAFGFLHGLITRTLGLLDGHDFPINFKFEGSVEKIWSVAPLNLLAYISNVLQPPVPLLHALAHTLSAPSLAMESTQSASAFMRNMHPVTLAGSYFHVDRRQSCCSSLLACHPFPDTHCTQNVSSHNDLHYCSKS